MMKLIEYRGHIRNYRELCSELDIDSTLSREQRESEIITKGYEKWGSALPDKLYGMFAFCISDTENDEIFCARDHFGTKPFYYYITESGKLLCGTMIRGIMEQEGFVKELNTDMLQIYMSLTYVGGEDTFSRA